MSLPISFEALIAEDIDNHLPAGLTCASRIEKEGFQALAKRRIESLQRIIIACQKKTTAWNCACNSLPVVSRLPDELVAEIFLLTFVENEYHPDLRTLYRLPASQVCSRWRRIALDCAEIWSYVPFVTAQYGSRMIERARGVPLKIAIFNEEVSSNNVVDKRTATARIQATAEAFRNLHRAEQVLLYDTFGYTGTRHAWEWGLDPSLDLPLLKHLTIKLPTPLPASIPFDRLLRSTPHLSRLTLGNCVPQGLMNGAASSLTYLEVAVYSPGDPWRSVSITILDTISMLGSLKKLRTLVLSNAISPLSDEQQQWCSESTRIVSLPELESFGIYDSSMTCKSLLEKIAYPPSLQLFINCSGWAGQQIVNFYNGFWSAETSRVQDILRTIGSRLKVDETKRLDICGREHPSSIWLGAHIGWKEEHRCSFSFGPRGEGSRNAAFVSVPLRAGAMILPSLPSILPLGHLKELSYDVSFSDEAVWLSLGDIESVESLTIGFTSPSFLHAFSSRRMVSNSDSNNAVDVLAFFQLPFRRLRQLNLLYWDISFTPDAEDFSYPRGRMRMSDVVSLLLDRQRLTNQSPLEVRVGTLAQECSLKATPKCDELGTNGVSLRLQTEWDWQ